MIDTHAHLNFVDFKDDIAEVTARIQEKKMRIINVGSQLSTSRRAVELAEKNQDFYAAVGLHPIHLEDSVVEEAGVSFRTRKEDFNLVEYRKLAVHEKVLAIGEIGLDYYYINDSVDRDSVIAKQKQIFTAQLDLANELNLPVIVHTRSSREEVDEAYLDILEILKKQPLRRGGVLHCYLGSADLISAFAELGFYFSFNGILTFDKSGRLEKSLLSTPRERLLTETDSPYLTPLPFRGKRNEPVYLSYVIEKIATCLRLSVEDVDYLTTNNAIELFKF